MIFCRKLLFLANEIITVGSLSLNIEFNQMRGLHSLDMAEEDRDVSCEYSEVNNVMIIRKQMVVLAMTGYLNRTI
jgi:hypothetical protein